MFSKGFPTNRIPVVVPSTGQIIVLRETTVTELKSMSKIVIDNIQRRQMNVIYNATVEYLQSMILTDGVDVWKFTEFDKLFCLMVFFQVSFYRDAVTFKCPHCNVEINYRYDMSDYLSRMQNDAYVGTQTVELPYKGKRYVFDIGWPTTREMSSLYNWFYTQLGEVTEEMENTQFGINFVLAFIKRIKVLDLVHGNEQAEIDLTQIDEFVERLDCVNSLPSLVMFDETDGLFSKITGYFVNRLENCFHTETCPQCHMDTNYGISQSSLFYSLFYGTMQSIYGFILQVECLLLFRYDSLLFANEQHLTYNDLQTLMKQLSTTVEKDNQERQKGSRDNLYKGLWLIREILNTMIFPQDKKH